MSTSTPGDGASREDWAEAGLEAPEGAVAGEPQPDGSSEPDAISKLEAERTDLKERLLRSLADMENLRRRTERDVAEARAYAVTAFARDMLNVADNIRRALESVPSGAGEPEGSLKALVDGIELTERDLLKSLERHGVKRVDPLGVKFDPNMHQAMFEVPDDTVPSGTVKQVIQGGFAIGDRVLRPALVGVAKGGPKAAAAPAPGAAEAEPAPST